MQKMTVLEWVSLDTLIFLQKAKRVWPAAEREVIFWSHTRPVDLSIMPNRDPKLHDTWITCNKSIEYPGAPVRKKSSYYLYSNAGTLSFYECLL